MNNRYLHIVVFVCGAAVLCIEILGTRILGPFYGVDIFLWSSLITVTLAALSIGYIVGGRIADTHASVNRLCRMILIAGLWMIAVPWLKHPVLDISEPLGLRAAILLSAFVLFFPPLMLLGTVGPFAIKLKTANLSKVGSISGNLFALSTVGSVLSALATGFFLIPQIGVQRLTLGVGFVLLITAIIGLLSNKKSAITTLTTLIVLPVIGFILLQFAGERPAPEEGLLAIEQSPYAELRVVDTDAGRHLLIDGGIHSLVDTSTWESSLRYTAVMDLPKYFFKSPGTMLLIGLGGGSLVKQYAHASWNVDAVEIDPAVIRLAQTYFNLKPTEGNIYEMDGRRFISTTNNRYDVILLDAFGSSAIPFHLVTKEAFGLIAAHLTTQGIFALNVETIGWNDPIINNLASTLQHVFREVLVLPIEEPPNSFGNIILLASDRKLEPVQEPERNVGLDPDWRYGPSYQKVHAWDNRFTPRTNNTLVFTDDLNSIGLRAGEINLAARKDLHQYFQHTGMSW